MSDISTVRVANSSNDYSIVIRDQARFLWAHLVYTSTGTAGNRQIRLGVKDAAGNLIWDTHAGAVQAASLTRHYSFMPGIYRETSFLDGEIQVSVHMRTFIPGNYTLFVVDENGVDASDSMVFTYQLEDEG